MQTTPQKYYLEEEEDTIDVMKTLHRFLQYWYWFVLGAIICLLGSFLYLRYTSKIYETSAKIKIIDQSKGMDLNVGDMLFNQSKINLENEIEIISSYQILEKVVKILDLTTQHYEEGNIRTSLLDKLPFSFERIQHPDSILATGSYKIIISKEGFDVLDKATGVTTLIPNYDSYAVKHSLPFQIKMEDAPLIKENVGKQINLNLISEKSAVLNLKNSLKISQVGKKSELIKIALKGESSLRSERIINTLIQAFNDDGINDRQLVFKRTINFIDDRFIFLSQELDSIEGDKKDFKQSNNLVFIEADSELSLEKKAQSDEELFRIENQSALSELLSEALESSRKKSGLLPQNIGLDSNIINNLIGEYNTAILERDKLTNSGGINNPIVQQLVSTLNGLRLNIDTSILAYKKQLKVSKKQLLARSNKFSSEVYQLPGKEKLLRAINRQQKIKESLYLLLLQKREEAAINLAVTEPSIKVVEYALSGSQPISPKPAIVYAGGLALGLLIPFGIIFIIFMLDTKIHSKNDVEALGADIPILGEIPAIKKNKNIIFSDPNDRSVLAEAFRIVSSNASFILPANSEKGSVLICTSSVKGEGKSFVSVNLSLALSSINKKVLLIGADLRNPQLHAFLKLDKNQKGLSNYLHNVNEDWKSNLIQGFPKHPNHDTLISGEIPPNPPHLLSNGRLELLLNEARELYDYIIIDTAPTVLVTDTLLISKYADATIYIVKANYTEKELLHHAVDFLKKNKVKNMAFVINSVGDSKKAYGSKYGYNYGYGYGYTED